MPVQYSQPIATNNTDKRDYFTRLRSACTFGCSFLLALGSGIALTGWVRLPSLEKALLATLSIPLLWAALMVILLNCSRWRTICSVAAVGGVALLGAQLLVY
ncbi:MAG: hypothetical protein WBA20_00570 [Ketobacter sp.]